MNTAPINHRDPIEYLINAMERAGQEDKPAEHSYGEKRLAVLAPLPRSRLRSRRNERRRPAHGCRCSVAPTETQE
jgi:hypothetical protein